MPLKTMVDAIVQLVKDHGLVVVAMVALVWQILFMGRLMEDQDDRWHRVLEKIDTSISAEREYRQKVTAEVLVALAKVEKSCLK